MNEILASLQLTIASGGGIIVVDHAAVDDSIMGVGQDAVWVVSDADEALQLVEQEVPEVVICSWPADRELARQLSEGHRVSVMMVVPVSASRSRAIRFARQLRDCAILPESFSLVTLLGADTSMGRSLSASFLRRLPRLTRLWGNQKTGVVQFLQPDGAWDWIEVKDGGLVRAGELSILQTAMQSGRLRFLERVVHGDPSRDAMGRLLIELAGTLSDTRFAMAHQGWIPEPCLLGDLPLSQQTRFLLWEADGERSLGHLLRTMGIPFAAVSEELHALVRLRLVHLKPPEDFSLHPLHSRLRARLERERALLRQAPESRRVLGLTGVEPMALRRKVARWQHERYARISEEAGLAGDLQHEAAELSETWREIFLERPDRDQ
jgi:hypothetical protein